MSDLVRVAAPAPATVPQAELSAATRAAAPATLEPARAPMPRVVHRPIDKVPEAPLPSVLPLRPERETATAPATPGGAANVFDDAQVLLAIVRELVKAGQTPSWPDIDRLAHRIVTSLEQSNDLLWIANAATVPAHGDYLVVHQSRVAVLAVRIGLNAGYDHAQAVGLGVAGALIDVGLWQTPDALLRRTDALTPDEQSLYRAHPQRSAELLARWGAPDRIVDAVLQHHEREQGQGFPQHLVGATIRHEAKILGLVDAYTGLTLPASRRPGLRPHEAIREIVRSKHESFAPALIKALLAEISVFPPGTLVRLNTGEVGQVTAVNRNHPLRPRVTIVADSKGHRPATPKTIDLSETPFLYITGPVSEPTK